MVWDYLDIQIPVSRQEIVSDSISFEAWDDDLMKDKLIGVGDISLSLFTAIDSEVTLHVSLLDKKRNEMGRIKAFAKLEKLQPKQIEPEEINSNFVEGTFYIRRIRAIGLTNTELFGKIDPFVICTFGEVEHRTNVLENAVGYYNSH